MSPGSDAASPWRRATALVVLLLALGCGDDPVDPDPSCDEAEPLPFRETRVRVLGPTDAVLQGARIDYYAVRPDTPGELVVEMTAEAPLDPFLHLWTDAGGDPVAQAFDPDAGGPVLEARLVFPVGAGCYRVGASTWESGVEGEYTIRADLTPSP